MEEILEYMESEQINADILALPPDSVDALTDEEDIDDEVLEPTVLQEIPGSMELNILEDEEQDNGSLEPPKKKSKSTPVKWSESQPRYSFPDSFPDSSSINELKNALEGKSVVDLFEEFFDEAVLNLIVTETTRYAQEIKNKTSFNVSMDSIKVFIGFLVFSGYHTLSNQKDYWSEDDDLGVQLVKDAMSRNSFLEIKSNIHFQNNNLANENKNDRGFKIRPLMDLVNKNFQKWSVFHENLSVDEMIVRYYGNYPIKQFIKGKPIRFGYKLWAMCGDNGYCYNFSLYCGKSLETTSNIPLGSQVVLSLLNCIQNPSKHKLFFDNYFTSHDLLVQLKNKGFRATGTVRENRLKQCPVASDKLMKSKERGYFDYKFDKEHQILAVKWYDNKCFSIATNFDSVFPLKQVKRWCRNKKEKINVGQPQVINTYKNFMGGVDQHDWLLEKHTIAIRGKKWYWCLFTRMIDMAIVNVYALHKIVHNNSTLSIKDIRRQIARTYLSLGKDTRVARGRPSTSRSKVLPNIRYDGKNHILDKRGNQRHCQLEGCKGRPRTFCSKCDVTLCIPCFKIYHNQ
jgi:DNA excision repair protein ERCC-6